MHQRITQATKGFGGCGSHNMGGMGNDRGDNCTSSQTLTTMLDAFQPVFQTQAAPRQLSVTLLVILLIAELWTQDG